MCQEPPPSRIASSCISFQNEVSTWNITLNLLRSLSITFTIQQTRSVHRSFVHVAYCSDGVPCVLSLWRRQAIMRRDLAIFESLLYTTIPFCRIF